MKIAFKEPTPEQLRQWVESEAARARAVAADLKRAQREALEALDLPTRDIEIIRSGAICESQAIDALRGEATILVLSGAPGCGKTLAASVWIHGLIADDANWDIGSTPPKLMRKAAFVSAPKLSRWKKYDDEAMERILRAHRVAIDDLGLEYLDAKGSYQSLLDELINERYAHKRPTLLTTNLPASEFKERYGERIADRIREAGRFVELDNQSFRTSPKA